ncbi:hypothetical protein PMEGAS67_33230 [Priestia megaterium]|jgi:hypothetical protein
MHFPPSIDSMSMYLYIRITLTIVSNFLKFIYFILRTRKTKHTFDYYPYKKHLTQGKVFFMISVEGQAY